MITDKQRNEITELQAHYNDGLIAAVEAGIKVADIVFPRDTLGETVEAALRTKVWRDFDASLRPQVEALFATLLK